MFSKSDLTHTPDGVTIRLIIVVRVPIVQVGIPRILCIVTVRSSRPVIVSHKYSSLSILPKFRWMNRL